MSASTDMKKKYAVGVDVGGSHITSAIIDLIKGEILNESRATLPVNQENSRYDILEVWGKALANSIKMIEPNELAGIGFAVPGPFDYVNGISLMTHKLQSLYKINIGENIRDSLTLKEDQPIRFINDATAFAVGEAWAGKAQPYKKSVSITLGTGFGSAFIDNKIPVVSGDAVPELGCTYHLKFKDGIADNYFGTSWYISRYKDMTGILVSGVKELANQANAGDALIKSIFKEFGESLGIFMAPLLNTFGAEVLVIGGNISRTYSLFGSHLEESLRSNHCETIPVVSDLREDAGLLGCAYLLNENYWPEVKDLLKLM